MKILIHTYWKFKIENLKFNFKLQFKIAVCGIVGYIGKKQALPFLIDGLKRLQYRGYDSSGICVKSGSSFYLLKKPGKVVDLEARIQNSLAVGDIGIAHTRWATHGVPNEINAHPHLDCKGSIAIVHNGIVENYNTLKEMLKNEGHKIISQTDSEIISHLIEKFYDGDVEIATIKALKLIEGAYALAILDRNSEKIIIARKSSPLVLGVGTGENFVASDVSAMLKQTKKVIYLDDNEIAILTRDSYAVKNVNGDVVDKKVHEVKMTMAEIEKKGFKHFMLKEIFEQPEAIENALRGRISGDKVKLNLNLVPSSISRIIITACGTSWHSGLIGKYIIEKLARIPVEVDYASEFRYRDPIIRKDDLIIVISQSGETADTLAALKEAKQKGAKTLGIVNVVGSTIAREVDSGIYLHAGPEVGVATTKAFSCQVVVLTLLAIYLQEQKRETNGKAKEALEEIKKIPDLVRKLLGQSEKIRDLAQEFKDYKNFLFLGRNLNFPVALEGALKLKEISYIHAEGYPAAEMKHGPIALIDENMPVVFICPKDGTYNKILNNMEEVKARGGNIIAIINEDDEKITKLSKHIIKVPKTIDILSLLVNVLPLQLLAYHIADLKDINVDKPRNLAKSVTVE